MRGGLDDQLSGLKVGQVESLCEHYALTLGRELFANLEGTETSRRRSGLGPTLALQHRAAIGAMRDVLCSPGPRLIGNTSP